MARSVINVITSRRIKYLIILFWLIVVAVAAPLAGKLTGAQKNDAKSWLPNSAESTKVLDEQEAFASPDTIPAVIVYERSSGLTEADKAKANADAATFKQIPEVDGQVTGPIISQDGQAAQIVIPLNLGPSGWDKAHDVAVSMRDTATTGANGLSVHVTGPIGFAADSASAFEGLDSTLLFSTIAVVVVILLFSYRSPTLWLLPVISAGVALTVAQAVIYLLTKAGLVVNAQSAGILTVLVFGAGTDYALLLVARYREELRRHHDRHEAMAVALHRAGPAILASGATVVISMLCLMLAKTQATKGLGPVAAIGILVGLAVMLTLLPAMLVTVGRWVFWPAKPKEGTPEPTSTGVWSKVGANIAKAPRMTWIVTCLILAAMALGIVQLNATGLTNKESFTGSAPDSVVGEEIVAKHFPAGAGNPVVVIANASAAAQVRDAVASTQGIDPASVTPPVVKDGKAYVQGTLNDQADSQAAYDTVDRVRDKVHAIPGAEALVGGNSAINLDVQRAAAFDRNLIIPIILLVVFVILALLLRAVLAPVLLIATVVLSFGAALGASALFFKHVLGFEGADTSLPLFVFVFLVALGIDYNIFLMTRVREEAIKHGTRRAALIGLAATGGVITSAGLVLAGTFAVLGTLPLVAFAEIGFAVAFGVLLDTLVVRSVLVTALNLDIGPRVWWPNPLSRRPDVAPAEARELVRESA